MLVNMFPRLAANDLADCRNVDRVVLGDVNQQFASGRTSADCPNIGRGEFPAGFTHGTKQRGISPCWMPVSGQRTSLRMHVVYVVGSGSKKQMIGSDATRIVTTMQNHQSIRDGAIRQFPRHTVRAARLSVAPCSPVTLRCQCASPHPAITGCVNCCPESISEGDGRLEGHRSLQSADVAPVAGETAHRLFDVLIIPQFARLHAESEAICLPQM